MKCIAVLGIVIAFAAITTNASPHKMNERDQLARFDEVSRAFNNLNNEPQTQVVVNIFQRIGQSKHVVVKRKRLLGKHSETQQIMDLDSATAEALAGIYRQEHKRRVKGRLEFAHLYNVHILAPCKHIRASHRVVQHYIEDIAHMRMQEAHQLIGDFGRYVQNCERLDERDTKSRVKKAYLKELKLKEPQVEGY